MLCIEDEVFNRANTGYNSSLSMGICIFTSHRTFSGAKVIPHLCIKQV